MRSKYIKKFFVMLIIYLLAGAVESTFYYEVFAGGGHPDVPFTEFPEYMVWAPIAPILLIYYFIVDLDPAYGYSTVVFILSCVSFSFIRYAYALKTSRLPVDGSE
jgi:hypothetical protein